jgi:hypothetical protein
MPGLHTRDSGLIDLGWDPGSGNKNEKDLFSQFQCVLKVENY